MIVNALKLIKPELNKIRKSFSRDTATTTLAAYLDNNTPTEYKFKVTPKRGSINEITRDSGGVVGAKSYGTVTFIELYKNIGDILGYISDAAFDKWFNVFIAAVKRAVDRPSKLDFDVKPINPEADYENRLSSIANRGKTISYMDKKEPLLSPTALGSRVNPEILDLLKSKISTSLPNPYMEKIVTSLEERLRTKGIQVLMKMSTYQDNFSSITDVLLTMGVAIVTKTSLEIMFPSWKFVYKTTMTKNLVELDTAKTLDADISAPRKTVRSAPERKTVTNIGIHEPAKEYFTQVEDELLKTDADEDKIGQLMSDPDILDELRKVLMSKGTHSVKATASELYNKYLRH